MNRKQPKRAALSRTALFLFNRAEISNLFDPSLKLDISRLLGAFVLGPVHIGTISYCSTSVCSKKWYGEGLRSKGTEKIKRSVPKQVQKLGSMET